MLFTFVVYYNDNDSKKQLASTIIIIALADSSDFFVEIEL